METYVFGFVFPQIAKTNVWKILKWSMKLYSRGNNENQDQFSSVVAPMEPVRPVLVLLLISMVNDKQPFLLRCSVLYCVQVSWILKFVESATFNVNQLIFGSFPV